VIELVHDRVLELNLARLDARQPHRVRGGAATLGGAARVEDLEVAFALVQWQMGVAEDNRLSLRIRPRRGPAPWITASCAPSTSALA
jgi:hypothetical protein